MLRLALFATGLFIGLTVPSWLLLEHEVVARFTARSDNEPSRVYARPLVLYPGLPLSVEDLIAELDYAGYQAVAGPLPAAPPQPGRYVREGRKFALHSRAFEFADGRQAAQRLLVTLTAGGGRGSAVESVYDAPSGSALRLARLDPAEIGMIAASGDSDRLRTALRAFPPRLIAAIQAVEDRRFKHHHGLDPNGLLRALWINLRRGAVVQGGSTITQQLVKNLYLGGQRDWLRKYPEALMALALERHFDKGEILEAYLNEVYLGQDGPYAVRGFARAAEFYFAAPLDTLDDAQLALLVGMVRGASWYNPRRHPERARSRRDQVLKMMRDTHVIAAAEYRTALTRPLGVLLEPPSRRGRHPAFIDLVRRQLRRDYSDRQLAAGGLRIMTTLEPRAQAAAEAAMAGAARLPGGDDLQAAMLIVAPASGDILAVTGDRDATRRGFNRALDARRQIGSLIKPLVYLEALQSDPDLTLLTPLDDQPVSVPLAGGRVWSPENFDRRSHGQVPLALALSRSYNQASVRLGLQVGIDKLAGILPSFGVRQRLSHHPSVLLGALELTPVQVAQMYQPLAAGGYYTPLGAVRAVIDSSGVPLARYPARAKSVFSAAAGAQINYALTLGQTDGTARGLPEMLGATRRIATKTGTTNERRDAWFVGYTGNWLGVVWTGRDDGRPAGITGSSAAMPLWAAAFSRLGLDDLPVATPGGIAWYWVDWPNAELADEHCAARRAVPFTPGHEPKIWSKCVGRLRSFMKNF